MPASVVVALIATGLMVLVSGISGVGQLAQGQSPIVAIISVAVGLIIMAGIAKGHRLAHQWGRILVFLTAVLYTIGAVFGAAGAIMLVNNPEMMGPDAPAELANANLKTAMLVGMGFLVAFVVLLWTVFFTLGTQSARRYFQLVCPQCGHTKVKANDFFYNRGRCKRCSAVW